MLTLITPYDALVAHDSDVSDIVRHSEVNPPPRVRVGHRSARPCIALTINSVTCQPVAIQRHLNGRLVQRQIYIGVIQFCEIMHTQYVEIMFVFQKTVYGG